LYRFSNLHRISGSGQLRACQLEVSDAFTLACVEEGGVGTCGTLDAEARALVLDATRDDRRRPAADIATKKEVEGVAANAGAPCGPDWESPRREFDQCDDGEEKALETISNMSLGDFSSPIDLQSASMGYSEVD
jgi:hypothetical protein